MNRRAQLVESVRRLGWPADLQLKYLGALGASPCVDELILEFDDAVSPCKDMVGQGELSHHEAKIVSQIIGFIREKFPADSDLWTEYAVQTSPVWEDLRQVARSALIEFGE